MKYLIAGFGNIGKKRARALGKKFSISYDPDKNSGSDFQKLEDIPTKLFDAAVLTVPQKYKFELTKYFLSLGKYVLNEKPFIVTKNQILELQRISKKTGGLFYTSYNHRYEPSIKKIIKVITGGSFGKFYFGRMIYSFGNIKERIGTWRESEFGVLEEIAPHLIDLASVFFGYEGGDFQGLFSRKVESEIFDHWVFSTKDKKIIFETSSLSWKNNFSIELYFEKGSIHLSGLRKWGGSELIIRKRVLPAGVPKEKIYHDLGEDNTWKEDFKNFEKNIHEKKSSGKKDLQMSLALASIALDADNPKVNEQYKIYKEIKN